MAATCRNQSSSQESTVQAFMKLFLLSCALSVVGIKGYGYEEHGTVAVHRPVAVPHHQGKSIIYHHAHNYGIVDLTFGGSDYHFSWRHDGGKNYPWDIANRYCANLGYGWQGVSIESYQEDKYISHVLEKDYIKYIWTGGYRTGYNWAWPSGAKFYGLNWSYTGSAGYQQPDNYEHGHELCLAVLNNFYNDGIKWHDVACHHEKPIVCERRRHYYG
ncbi:L-selectin-like [Penaeus monodon]|uniref:L-selectin-like n=1 Tax=Penaeus monodon TaxID=6687 RepID=UPI0018A7B41E|nr:L-selectin-like [Penaeus monodon]